MKQSLRVKFLFFTASLIVCAMGITTAAVYLGSKSIVKNSIKHQLSLLVRSASDYMTMWLHDREKDLRAWCARSQFQMAIDDSYIGRASREPACQQLKEELNNYPYYESLNLADATGNIIASSDKTAVGNIIVSQYQFFEESLNGSMHLTSIMESPMSGKKVLILSAPIQKDGAKGILFGIIDIREFNRLFIDPIKIGRTGYVYLVGSDNQVIAHPDYDTIGNVCLTDYDWGRYITAHDAGLTTYTWKGLYKIAIHKKLDDFQLILVGTAGINEIFAPLKTLQLIILFITVTFIVIAVLSITILYKHVIQTPMRYLIDGITRFGKGQWQKPIILNTKDEFSNLAETFNKMANDLKNTTTSVDNLNREIAERKKVEEELLISKKAAEEASIAKSLFLANTSHEIRTPMNSILGFGSLLAEEDLTTEQQEYVECIVNSGEGLLQIINDILDLSKIESGKFQVDIMDCFLGKMLNNIESMFKNTCTQKGLDFNVVRHGDLPERIKSDHQRLQQCLINLIGNAVKFTEKGHVHLHVGFEEINNIPFIRFEVEDTGIGIPADKIDSVFEEFSQADNSDTRKYGGTGLGLSITRKLLHLLGGEISVKSELGYGATFVILLPVDKDVCTESMQAHDQTIKQR